MPLIASLGLLAGCFGYTPSARRWAYVGNTVLIAGGGATIALDVVNKDAPCMPDAMNNGCSYRSPMTASAPGSMRWRTRRDRARWIARLVLG